MKHIMIGDLEVDRIGLGAMGMSHGYTGAGEDDAESIRTIQRALDLGVTLIDTAEIYGPYINEELVGRALKGRRDQAVLATKFGWISHSGRGPGILDSSPASVRAAVEGSLTRLGTDPIDLCYQHRVDPATPVEDTIGALGELVAEGKVRHIGLSEAGPDTIRRAHAVHPIAAVQSEYSLWTRNPEPAVLPRTPGTGHRLRALLPARPRLPHRGHPLPRRLRRRLAARQPPLHRRKPPAQPAHRRRSTGHLSPGRRHPRPDRARLAPRAGRQHRAPIPGTKHVSRLEENLAADRVTLTKEQLHRLDHLTPAAGDTHNEAGLSSLER